MASHTFEARFPGVCEDCGGRIEVGDIVHRTEDGYEHEFCPDEVEATVKGQPCPDCNLVHRGECF